MPDVWSPWDEWVGSLPKVEQDAALALRDRFEELGAEDPEGWARSEICENIPQLARFLILRSLRRETVDTWTLAGALKNAPAARRLLAAGADQSDLLDLVQDVVQDAIFAVLAVLDEGQDPEAPEGSPSWSLVEMGAGSTGQGRRIEGLHEDLHG